MLYNSDRHSVIEESVSERSGSYRNLDLKALYTSEEDFRRIFSHPLVKGTFLDLGCGIGQGCILYAQEFPERQSIGLDFEKSRIDEGMKIIEALNLKNAKLKVSDLLTDIIPEADTYFLYFPAGHVLDRIFTSLHSLQKAFTLVVIESHSDLFPRIELENWLVLQDEIPLSSARHYPNAKVYLSNSHKREIPEPFLLSYQECELVIEDDVGLWTGSTFGLHWSGEDKFDLVHPPRTISWKSVKTLKKKSDFDPEIQRMIALRNQGPVVIQTSDRVIEGFIRKIYISPVFHLEISNGEKVELAHINKINIRT